MKKSSIAVCGLLLLTAFTARGQQGAAFKSWSDAVDKAPKDAMAYFNRGKIYAAHEDYDNALADFTKAIQLDPKFADAYVQRAVAAIGQEYQPPKNGEFHGDSEMNVYYMERWNDLNTALELDPKNVRGLLVRGEQYIVLTDYKNALADFETVIGIDPNNTAAFRDEGKAHTGLGKDNIAIADFTEAIRIDPNDAEAYRLRGGLFVAMALKEESGAKDGHGASKEDVAKAIADFTAEMKIGLGGKTDKAEKLKFALKKAQEASDPEAPQNGNPEMQIAYWSAVLDLDPGNATAWFQRAEAKLGCIGEREAAEDYDKAIQLDPKNVRARERRANIRLGEDGGMKGAATDLESAAKIGGEDSSGDYTEAGATHDAVGEYAAALADYNKAIEVNPKDYQGYECRGKLYAEEGQWEKAVKEFNIVIKLLPGYDMAYSERGSAYYKLRDWDKVIADFTKEIALEKQQGDGGDDGNAPLVEEAYVMCGDACARKGMYDKALTNYRSAIAACKDGDVGMDAEAWFYATCPKAEIRDGKKAVGLALETCGKSKWEESSPIDTLAAAYAEAGNWEAAVKFEKMALQMAIDDEVDEAENKDGAIEALNGVVQVIEFYGQQVNDYLGRLALYRQKQPCREEKNCARW